MKLLLDTHALIWYADNNPSLSGLATQHILDSSNELLLSIASVWEMAIKCNVGKLNLVPNYQDYLTQAFSLTGLALLDVTFKDCVEYEALPFLTTQHRDPYDRMIVTQALRFSLPVISVDSKLDGYGINRIW